MILTDKVNDFAKERKEQHKMIPLQSLNNKIGLETRNEKGYNKSGGNVHCLRFCCIELTVLLLYLFRQHCNCNMVL